VQTGRVRLRPLGDPSQPGRLDRAVARRAWGLARPFRRRLALFIALIVVGAVLGALPPQLVRLVIDDAIADRA
jgi:ATP-binding cassette, subfamily B, bacterial